MTQTPALESGGAVLLTQGSDEPYRKSLEIMQDKDFYPLLKLGVLFFDEIAICCNGILANPLWYKLACGEGSTTEHEALSRLFRPPSDDGLGVFRPIVTTQSPSATSIAESMIRNNTRHQLPSDDALRELAQFIDSQDPAALEFDDPMFRNTYYELMIELTHKVNLDGLRAWSSQDWILPHGAIDPLFKWIKSDAPKDNLRCSDAFRQVESTVDARHAKPAKVLSTAAYHYAISLAFSDGLVLSMPAAYVPFVDELSKIRWLDSRPNIAREANREEKGDSTVSVGLPMRRLAELPLQYIIELRERTPFVKLREMLANFRIGRSNVTPDDIEPLAKQCCEELSAFLSARLHGDEQVLLQQWEDEAKRSSIRMWINRLNGVLEVIEFFDPTQVSRLVVKGAAIATRMLNEWLDRKKTGNNLVAHYTRFDDELVDYSLRNGSTTERQEAGSVCNPGRSPLGDPDRLSLGGCRGGEGSSNPEG